MKRKNLPQFTDQKWFPPLLKKLVNEFLSWFVLKVNATQPFVPFFEDGIAQSKEKRIINIDLNAGAGMESCIKYIDKKVQITSLTLESLNTESPGLYTIINGIHKIEANTLKRILKQLAQSGNPVVAVEGNNNNWWQAFGMIIIVPITVLLTAFFVRPFRWTRILFTYLIPILPIIIPIDGIIALFKLYDPEDLKEICMDINVERYSWQYGKNENGRGGKIIYLKGYPELKQV